MSMIEKVARALCRLRHLREEDATPGYADHDAWLAAMEVRRWHEFIDDARAAIEAMEPTAAMARAMKPRPAHWPPRGADAAMDASIDADRLAAKQMFTAAIQAALEGEG